ncbi:MAG TPA: DUF5107 domain-containing protein [Terriglobales bacterium]|nr:DUF5107 domain-containing protein [Terriglobales bacterium]
MKLNFKRLRCIIIVGLLVMVLTGAVVSAQDVAGRVTLTTSETTWKTLAYELDENNGIVRDSLDASTIVEHTFKTYVLENDYLKVTLLPEMGGRILSMIYKPTGHEELYQNPLGVPYGIGEGNFYYNWLMVYGGIFPTFPEPEHGKTWIVPWDFKVITETPEQVTVAMSVVDDIAFKGAPAKFDTRTTGIEATFYITLKAGRSALDTRVVLHNPSDKPVKYEYWTCVTLAPGSQPGDTRTTAGAEIIAPVSDIKMPNWWPATTAQEQATDTSDVYTFDKLRSFKNWADMGIAYAYPDLKGANFWGVVNHDNQEGLIRIGNNDVTPGLKMWTWGYDSTDVDPFAQPTVESRPYIEMWAGVTPEFFTRTSFPANADVVIEETYSPTVGLANVTQASRDYLVNFYAENATTAHLQIFSAQPERSALAIITADSMLISETPIGINPVKGFEVNIEIPAEAKSLSFKLVDEANNSLLTGDLALN